MNKKVLSIIKFPTNYPAALKWTVPPLITPRRKEERTKLHRDEISLVMPSWVFFFFIIGTTCCKDTCNIHICRISTNQRRSFLYVAYLKVATRQVSVRCQQVSISMEVGRKDPWRRRKWRLNLPSNRVKLNLSIERGHIAPASSYFLFLSFLRLGYSIESMNVSFLW